MEKSSLNKRVDLVLNQEIASKELLASLIKDLKFKVNEVRQRNVKMDQLQTRFLEPVTTPLQTIVKKMDGKNFSTTSPTNKLEKTSEPERIRNRKTIVQESEKMIEKNSTPTLPANSIEKKETILNKKMDVREVMKSKPLPTVVRLGITAVGEEPNIILIRPLKLVTTFTPAMTTFINCYSIIK